MEHCKWHIKEHSQVGKYLATTWITTLVYLGIIQYMFITSAFLKFSLEKNTSELTLCDCQQFQEDIFIQLQYSCQHLQNNPFCSLPWNKQYRRKYQHQVLDVELMSLAKLYTYKLIGRFLLTKSIPYLSVSFN